MTRLFHFVAAADRAHFDATSGADWSPPSLASEGFLHLSFAEQLAGTLAVHFASAPEVLLVEVDRPSVEDALVVEVSRGDEAFPHVYRPLRAGECLRAWRLERAEGGGWTLPVLGATAAEDQPAGEPVGQR